MPKTNNTSIIFEERTSRSKGLDPTSYAPIARALLRVSDEKRARLKCKFDVAYFVANEKLTFKKYTGICDLEKRHGVDLGTTYMNNVACKTFIHFIAEAERQQIGDILTKAEIFSLFVDFSSDKGCCDNEVVMVMWCDHIHIELVFSLWLGLTLWLARDSLKSSKLLCKQDAR